MPDTDSEPPLDRDPEHTEAAVDLARVAWILTTLACLIAAIIVLLRGDNGYAAVAFAVALAAAINLT